MMGDREKTLWFIITMISICSILVAGMKLYPITKEWENAVERSQNTQIGADKDLENIINFLENRLQYRLNYEFNLNRHAYFVLSKGKILINGLEVNERDGVYLSNLKEIKIDCIESSEIIFIDLPLMK